MCSRLYHWLKLWLTEGSRVFDGVDIYTCAIFLKAVHGQHSFEELEKMSVGISFHWTYSKLEAFCIVLHNCLQSMNKIKNQWIRTSKHVCRCVQKCVRVNDFHVHIKKKWWVTNSCTDTSRSVKTDSDYCSLRVSLMLWPLLIHFSVHWKTGVLLYLRRWWYLSLYFFLFLYFRPS